MEAAQYPDKKAEREQKIVALEAEKAALQLDVINMKEKLAQLEFEKSVRTLQGEIEALKAERTALEENARAYESEAQTRGEVPQPSQPNPPSPVRVEQTRPPREAVPGRNPIQQRPPMAAGIPRPSVTLPSRGLSPKSASEA